MPKRNKQPRKTDSDQPVESRRALLKGAVKAMPALVTLQSGAAFARSSNLISASPRDHKDRWRRTLCLDLKSAYPADGSRRLYDLGEPAFGKVSAIRDRYYYGVTRHGVRRVSAAQMCEEGGTYYYRERQRYQYGRDRGVNQHDLQQISELQAEDEASGYEASSSFFTGYGGGHYSNSGRSSWRRVKLNRGVLVSATALSSFAGNIVVKDL